MIYNALIASHINYGLPIWQGISKKVEKHLQVLMNKGIRACFCLGYRDSTANVSKKNGIFTFKQQCKYMSALLVKSTRGHRSPKHLKTLFQDKPLTRSLRSSQDDQLLVPCFKTSHLQQQSSFSLPHFWNKIPQKMKALRYISFKENFKKMIINEETLN